jgi:hypothetical protein
VHLCDAFADIYVYSVHGWISKQVIYTEYHKEENYGYRAGHATVIDIKFITYEVLVVI